MMVYSFARIGAATGMRVEDVFTDQRRLWVRLNEEDGKRHEMPCHDNLEAYYTHGSTGAVSARSRKLPCSRRLPRAADEASSASLDAP